MKRSLCLGALLLLVPTVPAGACINHYERPTRPPRRSAPDAASEFMASLRDQSEEDRLVAGAAPVDPGPNADFKVRNDYAAALVHHGEAQKAVEILESIEKSRPGERCPSAASSCCNGVPGSSLESWFRVPGGSAGPADSGV